MTRAATGRWLNAGITLLALAVGAAPAAAQRPTVRGTLPPRPAPRPATAFYPNGYFQQFPSYYIPSSPGLPVNPNYWVAPGLTLNQYAYNLSVLGQALGNFPPWAFGYNPYPAVANFGPAVNVTPLYNPFLNPYAGVLGGAYVGNPYLNLWP